MPMKKYQLDILDPKIAHHLDELMNHYGQQDNYSDVIQDSSITSWQIYKRHRWEKKTYTLKGFEDIKVLFYLKTPHKKDVRGISRPLTDKETLSIILTKKEGERLEREEIEAVIDGIGKETGEWKIKELVKLNHSS